MRPQARVPCWKPGFQPWPCSPWQWPWKVPYPSPAFSFRPPEAKSPRPHSHGDLAILSLPHRLNWVSDGFQVPPHPPTPAPPHTSAGTRGLCGASDLPPTVAVRFGFPHAEQTETRLCGKNKTGDLVTLVSSSPRACSAGPGLARIPLLCTLTLPQGPQPLSGP